MQLISCLGCVSAIDVRASDVGVFDKVSGELDLLVGREGKVGEAERLGTIIVVSTENISWLEYRWNRMNSTKSTSLQDFKEVPGKSTG